MNRTLVLCIVFGGVGAGSRAQEYCVPQVDVINSAGAGILNVSLDGSPAIDHDSPTTEGYHDTALGTTLVKGGVYILSVDKISGIACADNNVRAYIDFNRDHVFNEATESVALLNYAGDGVDAFSFIVPYNAVQGDTRMRVCQKLVVECGMVPINACGTGDTVGYRGEIEDYLITISGQVGVPEAGDPADIDFFTTGGQIMLASDLDASGTVTLDVMDLAGRTLVCFDIGTLPAGPERRAIATMAHPGLYLARLTLDGRQRVFRIRVE